MKVKLDALVIRPQHTYLLMERERDLEYMRTWFIDDQSKTSNDQSFNLFEGNPNSQMKQNPNSMMSRMQMIMKSMGKISGVTHKIKAKDIIKWIKKSNKHRNLN